jgi:septal ring factor EnvC (AmiA/AmiB activator)
VEQQNKQLQVLVNSLVTENMDLKRRISLTGEKLSSIERMIQDLKKQLPEA